MTTLLLVFGLTLAFAFGSALGQAVLEHTSAADVEDLRRRHPAAAARWEALRRQPETGSLALLLWAVLSTALGCGTLGFLAARHLPDRVTLGSAAAALLLLLLGRVVPLVWGAAQRRFWQPLLALPLTWAVVLMSPLLFFTRQAAGRSLEPVAPGQEDQEREIILLAEKSAREGGLSASERDLISNALSLDDVAIRDLLTPRTVVLALPAEMTVGAVCQRYKSIPFARLPVYLDQPDHIVGLVRRRDLLQAYAEDRDDLPVRELSEEVLFLPESATALNALHQFLQKHQQFAVVVDEFGVNAGVLTMEDIIEHLLGREIYEKSDPAIDMRELARRRARRRHPQAGQIS